MTSSSALPEQAGRRCHNVINPLHSTHYFSPDCAAELAGLGIENRSAGYFACRARGAWAPSGPGAVTATFYNFKHELVAGTSPRSGTIATPAEGAGRPAARRGRHAAPAARRRRPSSPPEMAEAAKLALRAAEACTRRARPLYAAHADLPVPEAPHLAYWHAATLLREHRGDGHSTALLDAGLDGWRRWSPTPRPARA